MGLGVEGREPVVSPLVGIPPRAGLGRFRMESRSASDERCCRWLPRALEVCCWPVVTKGLVTEGAPYTGDDGWVRGVPCDWTDGGRVRGVL